MPSSTAPGVSRQRQRQRHGGARGAYVGDLEVDGPVRVENVVEQVAVVVVAGKLGLEGGLELERGGGGLQLGVDVVVARDGGHAVEVLAVVLGRVSAHGLVLGVRIAVLVLAAHDGGRAACGACGRGPWWWWSKAAQNIQRVRGLGATCDNKTTALVLPKCQPNRRRPPLCPPPIASQRPARQRPWTLSALAAAAAASVTMDWLACPWVPPRSTSLSPCGRAISAPRRLRLAPHRDEP
jgi:hypothetical protein